MIRTKNSQNIPKHKNIFSLSKNENESKQEEKYNLEDYIFGKENIEKKLKEISANIEVIGKICDRKKKRSYEEYNSVLNSNKAMIEEELSKIRFKLVDALKNSTSEDLLKKLQKDFTNKKNQVYDTDKDLQIQYKILNENEHKINKLKEENKFLNQEIQNSQDYQYYLLNRLKECEENQKNKQNIEINISDQNQMNKSLVSQEKNLLEFSQNLNNIRRNEIMKLEKYFRKTEEMILQKLNFEEKMQKDKFNTYQSMKNFGNPIIEKLGNKIKEYQNNQENQMLKKVSSQEIFFNHFNYDIKEGTITKNQLTSFKNISLEQKLNKKDIRNIIKSFLEDEEIKHYIYNALYNDDD